MVVLGNVVGRPTTSFLHLFRFTFIPKHLVVFRLATKLFLFSRVLPINRLSKGFKDVVFRNQRRNSIHLMLPAACLQASFVVTIYCSFLGMQIFTICFYFHCCIFSNFGFFGSLSLLLFISLYNIIYILNMNKKK